jgi:superfamily II DNA or RNA helicase
MSYFEEYYESVRYPLASNGRDGLRLAQRGATFAVGAHFTQRNDPAIVVMPTGSGKTAVLMLVAFVLRAKRVLVVTPSRLVRYQIAQEFANLVTLKRVGALDLKVPVPRIYEVESKVATEDAWRALQSYDVVVGTPNSISPAIDGVAQPPEDLFDLILVDEAHHSVAKTWNELLECFPKAYRVLFTATPFRRDRREIKGRLTYSYSMAEAYKDSIFGQIEYHAVEEGGNSAESDIRIARAAEAALKEDHAGGLKHLLMVRTDTKTRAKELKEVYKAETDLKLQVIDSDHSYSHIKSVVSKLRGGELDGIICVDMLGEGFDLPELKIAAIHAPHKSLAITLQFIGRFARTSAPNIKTAKFFAVPSGVEGELARLYEEGAIWQELVIEMSRARIEEEVETREVIESFEPPSVTEPETSDISLYALRPYNHVKIYKVVEGGGIDFDFELPASYSVIFRRDSPLHFSSVFITRERMKPRWTDLDQFAGAEHHLCVIYFHQGSGLLFINSSCRDDSFYEDVASAVTRSIPHPLPLNKINKVLIGLENFDFFNIGMRSRLVKNNTESYRTISGSGAQRAISRSDSRMFNRGHIYGRAQEGAKFVTIGYSSSSKVWSNASTQIPQLIAWCQTLAERIVSDKEVSTFSGLDWIPVGETIRRMPEGVIAAEWDVDAFNNPPVISYKKPDGASGRCQLLDLDLRIDRSRCNEDKIGVCVSGDGLDWHVDYSLSGNNYFMPAVADDGQNITLHRGRYDMRLIDYLNTRPLNFFFTDFSRLHGSEHFKSGGDEIDPFDPEQVMPVDWVGADVDIEQECGILESGKLSVHEYLRGHLAQSDSQIVFYDHGPGEIADFVTFSSISEEILVRLYHCKGAGGRSAGQRVDDLYEVCGQVVKSLIWINTNQRLLDQIVYRNRTRRDSAFVKGEKTELKQIVARSKIMPTSYEIIIVQPGVSRSVLPERLGHILASANDYIVKSQCGPLRVLASA